jgi:phosphoribosylanthranilate isomerase
LAEGIVPVGVFVNAPAADIAALYRDGVIAAAQLHGTEDREYIARLKEASAAAGYGPIPVIKTIFSSELAAGAKPPQNADYYLVDSGAGSGKTFDWNLLGGLTRRHRLHTSAGADDGVWDKPLFLAGGISLDNIEKAIVLNPFAVDISSGAETDGLKDSEKIMRLTALVKTGRPA